MINQINGKIFYLPRKYHDNLSKGLNSGSFYVNFNQITIQIKYFQFTSFKIFLPSNLFENIIIVSEGLGAKFGWVDGLD